MEEYVLMGPVFWDVVTSEKIYPPMETCPIGYTVHYQNGLYPNIFYDQGNPVAGVVLAQYVQNNQLYIRRGKTYANGDLEILVGTTALAINDITYYYLCKRD
jgi:hypothetical protein